MTRSESVTPLQFNPFDPAFRQDPYPLFQRLREEAPVHKSPLGILVLSRYADCAAVLRDARASSDSRKSETFRQQALQQGLDPDELIRESTRSFLFMDPPDHTRLRGLVSKAFTPRVVEKLRPRIAALVDELLDAAAERREAELIEDLAFPLPVTVISEMLGVPPEDAQTFRGWSRELARSLDPDFALPQDVIERRQRAIDEFREYCRGLIARRRTEPADDLISGLIAAEEKGQKLTEDELLSTCVLLLVAGHETTVNLIGNGTFALLRHRDQFELLRDDPSLIRDAIEELLRFDPPVQLTGRNALEDIPLPSGAVHPKGQLALLLLASANRDSEQFPEPDRLDIRREDNRHLAFGMGIHFCLGAPLARLEGQIAIGRLVRRFPKMELAVEQPTYKENITLRGLAALPVSLEGRAY